MGDVGSLIPLMATNLGLSFLLANELMGLYQNNALEFPGIFVWKPDEAQ